MLDLADPDFDPSKFKEQYEEWKKDFDKRLFWMYCREMVLIDYHLESGFRPDHYNLNPCIIARYTWESKPNPQEFGFELTEDEKDLYKLLYGEIE